MVVAAAGCFRVIVPRRMAATARGQRPGRAGLAARRSRTRRYMPSARR